MAAPVSGADTLAGIEGEFRRLWSDAAATAREQGEPLLRASVVNLVVVTDGVQAVAEVGRTLVEVAGSVPGRMIVVAPDPLAPDGLDAWPSIQCRPVRGRGGGPAGAKVLCCEQVVVEARGAAAAELPAIVRPLLETDVPSFLWWRAPLPAEASALDRLGREVGTVIVDTRRGAVWADGVTPGGDPVAAVAGLLSRRNAGSEGRALPGPSAAPTREGGRALPGPSAGVWGPSGGPRAGGGGPGRASTGGARWTLRDLAFARVTPWRELTAALFDIVPCQTMLRRVQSVAIAGRPGAPEVRLYLGWLASRLGWRATGPGSPVARTYDRPEGGRLTVRIAPVEEGAPLARVAFEGPGARAWVQLGETTPAGQLLEAAADIEGAASVSQVVTVEQMTEARLVGGELTMAGDDRVYEAAVQAVIR